MGSYRRHLNTYWREVVVSYEQVVCRWFQNCLWHLRGLRASLCVRSGIRICCNAGGRLVYRKVSVAMKAWLSDVLKIGFGASLGFMMLFVLAFVFDDWVIPAVRMLVGWLTGFFE